VFDSPSCCEVARRCSGVANPSAKGSANASFAQISRSLTSKLATVPVEHHQKFEDKWSMISGADDQLDRHTQLVGF